MDRGSPGVKHVSTPPVVRPLVNLRSGYNNVPMSVSCGLPPPPPPRRRNSPRYLVLYMCVVLTAAQKYIHLEATWMVIFRTAPWLKGFTVSGVVIDVIVDIGTVAEPGYRAVLWWAEDRDRLGADLSNIPNPDPSACGVVRKLRALSAVMYIQT